jgi:hypothetical protein
MTTIEGADWTTYERGCVREEMLRITRTPAWPTGPATIWT